MFGESRVRDEEGFTLLELMIVSIVLPILVGAITLALISTFSLQGGVANRLSDSADAQVTSTNFEKDVQGASFITTNSASSGPAPCETAAQVSASDKQVLGLQWGSGQTSTAQTEEVSYVEVPAGNSNSLVRNDCQIGSTIPVLAAVVSSDVASGQTATVTCSTTAASECTGTANYTNSWVSAAGVTGVTINITEPGSNYPFTLVALPRASSPTGGQSTVTAANSGCGFATAGTGTYSSTLCFVDFSSYGVSPTACPGWTGYQLMSAPISNTPYTLTFCLNMTGAPAAPHAIPTYYNPPNSEAFLGNNGFYTGIPGDPALYQTASGTTTVSIKNIQVLDSNGNPATGWELVTGDAESTDTGESLAWAISGTGAPALNLLPNSPSSLYGNACAYPGDALPGVPPGVDLTGLGTSSVYCGANVSSDKTGTVMLQATTPNNLTVTMVGNGLEAMFLGILLP